MTSHDTYIVDWLLPYVYVTIYVYHSEDYTLLGPITQKIKAGDTRPS